MFVHLDLLKIKVLDVNFDFNQQNVALAYKLICSG